MNIVIDDDDTDGWMDGWMDDTDGWMAYSDGWMPLMDGWMHGWHIVMDGCH